jgi:micrococcal nuclease
MKFWVIDGDTIRDNTTRTVYRLANIDCPETGERARCYRERTLGERAKLHAIRLLKGARNVAVHPTGATDEYQRSIATIDVDGVDFGRLMMERGFARPWYGVREDWCGPKGGLVQLAEECSAKFHCKTCGGRAADTSQQNVVSFPNVFPTSKEALDKLSETEQPPSTPRTKG